MIFSVHQLTVHRNYFWNDSYFKPRIYIVLYKSLFKPIIVYIFVSTCILWCKDDHKWFKMLILLSIFSPIDHFILLKTKYKLKIVFDPRDDLNYKLHWLKFWLVYINRIWCYVLNSLSPSEYKEFMCSTCYNFLELCVNRHTN